MRRRHLGTGAIAPPTASSSLNVGRRSRDLEALAGGEVVDVLVIGGGITGVGVALDAATRGLTVALVERRDLANGTSRWSSKMVHGGLRYLAQGQPRVAWESAVERAILIDTTAPHLVRPLPGIIPLTTMVSKRMGAGISLVMHTADGLRAAAGTSRKVLPLARHIEAEEAGVLVPATVGVAMRGALLSWDGQLEDDARLVIGVARTAASYGARVITYATVTGVDQGGADIVDEISGERLRVSARNVVNATGVWAGGLAPQVRLRPSRGSHLLLRAKTFGDPRAALTVPVDSSGKRFASAIPFPDGLVQLGLTDDPADVEISDEPVVPDVDRDFLLHAIGSATNRVLTADDVIGGFCGFRPLLDGDGSSTSDLSRRHAVIEDRRTGLVTIVGGKLTTYRRMAQDTVDRLASRSGVSCGPCLTALLPLVGAQPRNSVASADIPERLVRRYGSEAEVVAAMTTAGADQLQPITPEVNVSAAELLFGIEHELAISAEDLIDRRCRVGLLEGNRAAALIQARSLLDPAAKADPNSRPPDIREGA
ncbi:MAG: glycerol-3-phosphate dehydrogenase/oxidase [Solirubrobacterales bacterium]|nr:glycerol-3-phosphate dehydrogenase/oxidase [Solirubrobacterales bacterium]